MALLAWSTRIRGLLCVWRVVMSKEERIVTEKPREYNISAIRDLLLAAFSAETLVRFCQDRSAFRPVIDEFSPGHGLADMVDEIVTFCEKQWLWDDLLREVEQENPRQFAAFQDRIREEEPETAPTPAPPRAEWPWQSPMPTWFWPAVGGVAVVLVVILALVFWPRRKEPPPEVVVVPNVRGQDCDRADVALESSKLVPSGRLWEANSEKAYDLAIRADPPSGTEVQLGSEVTLVCSLGPMTAVPDVREQDWESAQQWMTDCCTPSFETRLAYETASTPEEVDHVISTDPTGGELVVPGSLVTLIIGVEPAEVEVPYVANLTVEEASARLAGSYLSVGEIVSQTSERVRTDRAIGCDPPSGEMVEAGSEVVLVVSRGPEAVLVPDLIDWMWEAAQAELERLGLQAVKRDERYDDDIEAGRVIATDPYARKSVVLGHEIDVVVSLGLDPAGDRDGDGMNNSWEAKFDTDPRIDDADADPDRDGLTNLDEYRNQTNPLSADFPSIRVVLRYGGARLSSVTNTAPSVEIWLRDPSVEHWRLYEQDLPTVYDDSSGELTVYNAPAGDYRALVRIDMDGNGYNSGGDLRSQLEGILSSDQDTVRGDVELLEVLHLTEPVDNASAITRYHQQTFDLYDPRELLFRWEGVSGAANYLIRIWEWQYEKDTFDKILYEVVNERIQGTSYSPDLPSSTAGHYYKFHVFAFDPDNHYLGGLYVEYSCTSGDEVEGYFEPKCEPGTESEGYEFRVR